MATKTRLVDCQLDLHLKPVKMSYQLLLDHDGRLISIPSACADCFFFFKDFCRAVLVTLALTLMTFKVGFGADLVLVVAGFYCQCQFYALTELEASGGTVW